VADDESCPELQRHPVIRATSRWHNFSVYSSIYSSGVLVVARATSGPGRDMVSDTTRLKGGGGRLSFEVGVCPGGSRSRLSVPVRGTQARTMPTSQLSVPLAACQAASHGGRLGD
jgi:hypothetical protein